MSHISRYNIVFMGVILLLMQLCYPSNAQDERDRLEFFEGGAIDGTFGIRAAMLTGAGVQGALTGMTAPFSPESFVVFGNPAALGRINSNQLSIGISPEIEFDIYTLTDPQETINEEVDNAFDEGSFNRTGPFEHPVFSGTIARSGSAVTGLAACFLLDKTKAKWFGKIPRLLDRIAFGYYQPLYVDVKFTYSGLRMLIQTVNIDNPTSELTFYSSIKMNADLLLTADSWAVSGAKQLDKFWLGFGLTRADIGINLSAEQQTDGILSMAKGENAFGDPAAAWYSEEDKSNEFSGSAFSRLDGASWGPRLGVTYQPKEWVLFGADLRLQTKIELDGTLDMELHRFIALNLNAEEGEDKFDVTGKVRADELTRTYAKYFEIPSAINVEMPSSISLGASFDCAFHPSLSFTKYFGELAYSMTLIELTEYKPEYSEVTEFTRTVIDYKRGFKPDWSALLGFDIGLFQMAVGGTMLIDVNEGYNDHNGNPIPPKEQDIIPGMPGVIPRLSIGFDSKLAENITIGVLVLGLPEDALRLNLKFDF